MEKKWPKDLSEINQQRVRLILRGKSALRTRKYE